MATAKRRRRHEILLLPRLLAKGLGRAYEESLLPVMQHLGVEVTELDDWNCCGATAYISVEERKAAVLAARNLAIAEKAGPQDLMTPCSACYLVLNKTKHNMADFPEINATVQRALGKRASDLQRQRERASSARHRW